jgi:TolB-like protein/Flp pilus assembly protein TadD
MNEFLQRLKQRKLVQWAVAYVAAAFALLQGIDIVAQRFGWPEQTMRFVIIALSIGLCVTLVLAWYHGERGAQRVNGIELLILALILALGGGFLWHFAGASRERAATAAELPSDKKAPPMSIAVITHKSIAVLPFENLSEEKANAFFALGIQDEILTRLAKIGDLKVISRTSTAQYQSKPQSLTLIAQQLGVANILEGSVQKAGNAVHINVQLIKAATDAHLWAESYDRELKNIFVVEGEVAGAIADALKAKLTGAEKKAIAEKPTENMDAYDAYLRGLSIEQSHWSYVAWQEAIAAYVTAIQSDPKFALAWGRMASVRSLLYFNGVDLAKNSAASVKEAADQAIALQPDLGEAWVAQGDYRYRVLRDFTAGLQAFEEAQKRLPNNSLVALSVANVERRLGRWQDAETHYRKAAELDPRNLQVFEAMGMTFELLRRYDDAQAAFDRALEISPGEEDVHARKANVFRSAGRLEEVAKELAPISADSTNEVVRDTRVAQATYERRLNDGIVLATTALREIKPGELPDTAAKLTMAQLGSLLEWAGRPSEARAAFARALEAIKPTAEKMVPADSDGLPGILATVYAGLGEKDKALAQARQAVAQYNNDAVNKPGAEVILAQIQARFGDLDSALAALPHLLEVPAGLHQADLRYDPVWDPLRKDPRFQALLQSPAAGEKSAKR